MDTDAAVLDVARRTIDKMFAAQGQRPVDDSRFVPLVGCLVDAVAEQAAAAGRPDEDVARVRAAVMKIATDTYVDLRRQHDPEHADAEEDAETFAYLMKHGSWPR